MESFTRVFPPDWPALQNVLLVVGIVALVLGLFGFLARRTLRKHERQNRIAAEQIALLMTGEMMARSQEEGDRFSLKESNSIKALIAEAVLALGADGTRRTRRAIQRLKTSDSALATDIFAELARAKTEDATRATQQAAAALRHQGALTLPNDAHEALELFQQAYALDSVDTENLLALALVQFRLGDIPSVEALLEKAERGDGQPGREDIAGMIDMFAGVLHLRRGRLPEAIGRFESASRIFEAREDPKALVDAMMALASTQMKANDLNGALANYNKAAELCTKFNYEIGLAQLYADLGLLLQGLGKFAEAEQMLLKGFAVAEKHDELTIASVVAGNLALLYRETQDLDRAEGMVRQSLQLEERLKHRDGVARGNLNLGTILFEKARFEDAAACFKASLRLYEALGLPEHASNAVYNLGNAHRALKQSEQAESCYRRAIDLFMSANDASGVAKSAGNLGAVYLDSGRFDEAEEEFRVALDAARDAGEGRAIAMQMRNLAVLAHMRGKPEEACKRLRESLELCQEIDARTEALELKVLMGQIGCL
ncbi:MAG TPA: tetratricopeptide repeat protein [Methyloceanibacter sp.]|nr:tetratricopeptide repeat protein [Methyloceanibacter sp.]